MRAEIKLLHPKATIPRRATDGSVGFDVTCVESYTFVQDADECTMVSTGIAIGLPEHPDPNKRYEIQVRPRSGLAKKGFIIGNSPGTIDQDYRGEIIILMKYTGSRRLYEIESGERIAQIVFSEVVIPEHLTLVTDLTITERNSGGFGSTGTTWNSDTERQETGSGWPALDPERGN